LTSGWMVVLGNHQSAINDQKPIANQKSKID
jgi:hypothetical protein